MNGGRLMLAPRRGFTSGIASVAPVFAPHVSGGFRVDVSG